MLLDIFKKRQQLIRARKEMKNLPITQFDEFEPNGFMGFNSKEFVRIDASYIMDMYDDIYGKKGTHYKTCMDDIFSDNSFSKDDYSKMKVSCIVKRYDNKKFGKEYASAELCGSRVANLFGVDTNYVAQIKHNPENIIIVDFLYGEQKFDDLYDLSGSMRTDIYNTPKDDVPVRLLLNRITRAAQQKIPEKSDKKKLIYNLQRDFIRFYLLRRYILSDRDLAGVNMCFVHSGDYSDLHMGPAFDFERCFDLIGVNITNRLDDDMEFLVNKYPEQLTAAIKTFTFDDKKDKLKAIFDKFDCTDISTIERMNFIENMLININEYYRKFTEIKNQNALEK